MTEKNISVYKHLYKNCKPPEKVQPLFPRKPPIKIEILSSPLFENLILGSPSSSEIGEGVHTMYLGKYRASILPFT